MINEAEAPSVIKDEFAAVTVPCGLIKAAFNLLICSSVDTRIPLSRETTSAAPRGELEVYLIIGAEIIPAICIGMISSRLPCSVAS